MTNNSQSKNGGAVSSTDLLNVVTAKTVDFDMETWRDQDSSCLQKTQKEGCGFQPVDEFLRFINF